MKYRNPIGVALLPGFTFLIYWWVWLVQTKNELNRNGAKIPTTWLWALPFGGLIWLWKYGKGVELVTKGRTTQGFAFAIMLFLGSIGNALVQNEFNKVSDTKKNA